LGPRRGFGVEEVPAELGSPLRQTEQVDRVPVRGPLLNLFFDESPCLEFVKVAADPVRVKTGQSGDPVERQPLVSSQRLADAFNHREGCHASISIVGTLRRCRA